MLTALIAYLLLGVVIAAIEFTVNRQKIHEKLDEGFDLNLYNEDHLTTALVLLAAVFWPRIVWEWLKKLFNH